MPSKRMSVYVPMCSLTFSCSASQDSLALRIHLGMALTVGTLCEVTLLGAVRMNGTLLA